MGKDLLGIVQTRGVFLLTFLTLIYKYLEIREKKPDLQSAGSLRFNWLKSSIPGKTVNEKHHTIQ